MRVAGVASVRLVDLPGARHEVFMEAPEIRRQVLREIGALRQRGYNDRQIGEKIGVDRDLFNQVTELTNRIKQQAAG